MAAYLQLAQNVISCFESFEITHIPQAKNSEADRLAWIRSGIDRSSGHHNAWVEELPRVLWAYRTTSRTSTGETPFSMTYGTEAVLPVEVGEPSFRTTQFGSETNDQGLALNLDRIEIKRDEAAIRVKANQAVAA
ncbi:hypothetical protein UlMin_025867 [Ulmus minor]